MTQLAPDLVFNPMSPEFRHNAMEMYGRFLREDPVHRMEDGRWLLCRYADVSAALTDKDRFRRPYEWTSTRHPPGALRDWAADNMIGMNPPDHTRFRKALTRGFAPRRVAEMEQMISRATDELIAAMPENTPIDFIESFAYPLPIVFICTMLGIPVEDQHLFKESTAAIIAALEVSGTDADRARGTEAAQALYDYLDDTARQREKALGDDLISLLIQHEREDQLTRTEVIHAAITLLIAGHETTTHLLGNGLIALTRFPDQLARLLEDRSLIRNAVEEMLRYDPSLYVLFRSNREELVLDDKHIPPESFLFLGIAAANRDPAVFANPDRFDVTRPNASKHLSFAAGIHLCLGHAVARMEARIAYEKLLERFSGFELAGEPEPRDGLMFKGCHHVPVLCRGA